MCLEYAVQMSDFVCVTECDYERIYF